MGRESLTLAKGVAERDYGATVVAGDSVAKYTPVYLRYNGLMYIVTVESVSRLFPNSGWEVLGTKEVCTFEGLDTWSELGWTPLHVLIRHTVNKPVLEVTTADGMVHVTEDHSLLTLSGRPIQPDQVLTRTELMHTYLPPPVNKDTGITVEDAHIMGFMYQDGNLIPLSILHGTRGVRQAFLNAFHGAGKLDCSSHISQAQIYWLIRSMTASSPSSSSHTAIWGSVATSITLCTSSSGFVYDLSTGNHHFSAGVGSMVVHNTDSIMFMIPHPTPIPEEVTADWRAERMKYVFKKAEEIGADITARLPPELIFELEGVMFPSLFLRKKNYAAVLWMNPDAPLPKLKMKGLAAVRNDRSLLNKRLATDILRMAVQERSPEGAIQHLLSTITKLRKRELPMEDFVISKELHSLEPKAPSPHVQVCLRIRARDPSAVPPLGSKVRYVVMQGGRGENIAGFARSPEEITVKDIDLQYYFTKHIFEPLSDMLNLLVEGGQLRLKKLLFNEFNRQDVIHNFFEVSSIKSSSAMTTTKADSTAAKPKVQRSLSGAVVEHQTKKKKKKVESSGGKKQQKLSFN